MTDATSDVRRTQPERRARSRTALLEAAARGMSRYGYAAVSLESIAQDAGYSRGALYHQFAGKEELAIAVVRWVEETWNTEVGWLLTAGGDPVQALLAVARGHAVYCRRDVSRVLLTLRVELGEREHPVGQLITEVVGAVVDGCAQLVEAGRALEQHSPGPPRRTSPPPSW
ncbi:MAG: TetR/AcrR family transcriptional regulator [Geodermatophilaceae bacterium]